METLTIKIKNKKVIKFIQDLEDLNLIQMVSPDVDKTETKLSELLTGSISAEEAEQMHKELNEMRGKS